MSKPDDMEINALVLTALFGWRWQSKYVEGTGGRLTALHAGENDPLGYVPSNYYAPDWLPSDASAPRYADWDTANIKCDECDRIITINMPDFCKDRNLLPLLWEKASFEIVEELSMLNSMDGLPRSSVREWAYHIATSDPRRVAEAALRVLGHWPADWE